jgi:hypothetical protein
MPTPTSYIHPQHPSYINASYIPHTAHPPQHLQPAHTHIDHPAPFPTAPPPRATTEAFTNTMPIVHAPFAQPPLHQHSQQPPPTAATSQTNTSTTAPPSALSPPAPGPLTHIVNHTEPTDNFSSTFIPYIESNPTALTPTQRKSSCTKRRKLMLPTGPALDHPAAPLLQHYAEQGCPANVQQPFTLRELEAAIQRGAHPSACKPEAAAALLRETQEKVAKGYAS